MTRKEFEQSNEFKEMVKKITMYPKGFYFTLPIYKMTIGQRNAINIIIRHCIDNGIISSVSIGLDVTGNIVEETCIRL